MVSIIGVVDVWKSTLLNLGPGISVILIVLGGITYGLAQTQPAQMRGKWQSTAAGMIVGGIIVAAITGAATQIAASSASVLT